MSVNKETEKFILKLKELRESKGLSQYKLAELSGVAQPIINRMEQGVNSPNVDTVMKILAPLGKTLDVITYDEPVEKVTVPETERSFMVMENKKKKK